MFYVRFPNIHASAQLISFSQADTHMALVLNASLACYFWLVTRRDYQQRAALVETGGDQIHYTALPTPPPPHTFRAGSSRHRRRAGINMSGSCCPVVLGCAAGRQASTNTPPPLILWLQPTNLSTSPVVPTGLNYASSASQAQHYCVFGATSNNSLWKLFRVVT